MTPEQLGKYLDEIGQRLQPAGQYVFQSAVSYKWTEAAVGVFAPTIAFVLLSVALIYCARTMKWRGDNPENWQAVAIMIDGGLLFITFLALLFVAFPDIPQLTTPQYSAIRDILSQIKP